MWSPYWIIANHCLTTTLSEYVSIYFMLITGYAYLAVGSFKFKPYFELQRKITKAGTAG